MEAIFQPEPIQSDREALAAKVCWAVVRAEMTLLRVALVPQILVVAEVLAVAVPTEQEMFMAGVRESMSNLTFPAHQPLTRTPWVPPGQPGQ